MSAPAKRNIKITRGDNYSHAVRFVEPDGTTPLPKTGCSYRAQIRRALHDANATELTVDDSNLDEGIVVLTLDPASTDALPPIGVWDLEQTAPGGIVTTLLAGAVIVKDDVTR